MKPLVAIITPTYNHENYLRYAIESVLTQTYTNWVMVIINDGSTDSTLSVAEEYSKTDKRIKVLTQNNSGLENLFKTYNRALKVVPDAKYVSVLEADDFWEPQKIEVYLNVMEKENSVMAFGNSYTVDENNNVVDNYPKSDIIKSTNLNNIPIGSFLNTYLLKSFIPSPTLVFKAEVLTEIKGFQQPSSMKVVDYPTVLSFCTKGSFSYIDQPLANYRIHSAQATSGSKISAESAGKYALEFYNSLDTKIKKEVTLSEEVLVRNIEIRKMLNYFHRARIMLVNKEFKKARPYFLEMIKSERYSLKVRGVVGLLLSFVHLNFEAFASVIGRRKLV